VKLLQERIVELFDRYEGMPASGIRWTTEASSNSTEFWRTSTFRSLRTAGGTSRWWAASSGKLKTGASDTAENVLRLPINHALKIELANWWYYGSKQLQPKTQNNGGRSQYVWPATGSNEGFHPASGKSGTYRGTNRFVAPGALLAIPSFVEGKVHVQTAIGKRIKDAMTNYGGYIVDGTGPGSPGHNMVALCMDALVNTEMREHFGFNMAYPHGVVDNSNSTAKLLYEDLLRIFQNLYVVSNNAPNAVGGGGTPRKPRKPPICK
jgi:hypothetical protein